MLMNFAIILIAMLLGGGIGYILAMSHKAGRIYAYVDVDNDVSLRLEVKRLEDVVDKKVIVLDVKTIQVPSQD